jgi:hypothetical protein
MAIASGIAAPRVYVLPDEDGINAFAAGYAPNHAALVVTSGAVRHLTRDELQGVIGHEFSHVLNGDMRLNVQMIGVLAGILFVGEIGEFLMRSTSSGRRSRKGGGGGLWIAGLAIMLIGYVGLFFGRLIKAGLSRQREFLADASAVQFTRNADGIAGALAVIGGSNAGSLVGNRHAEMLSHMFFAPGVSMWLESIFATHPPLGERIRRIAPQFTGAEYFARRRRTLTETTAQALGTTVAAAAISTRTVTKPAATVLGPAARLIASVGTPDAAHVDYARALLASLSVPVREATASAEGAQALVLACALARDDMARKEQLAGLERARAAELAQRADALVGAVRALPAGVRLPVITLAVPSLLALPQVSRDALIGHLLTLVQADRDVTLDEFVLLTFVRHHLRPRAGGPPAVKYRSIVQVAGETRLVLSLLAHAGAASPAAADTAFRRGLGAVQLPAASPLPPAAIGFAEVAGALDRLAALAPFVKRLLIAACVETVTADDQIGVAEAELIRTLAATLECPVPPVLDATACCTV